MARAAKSKPACVQYVGQEVHVKDVDLSVVGARLKALRERRELTIREVAERAGVSSGRIGQLETEERANPSLDTMLRLQAVFELESLEALLGDLPSSRRVVTERRSRRSRGR